MSDRELRIAFLGDIVGSGGRRAAAHAASELRVRRGAKVVIANGENSRNGSGITPDQVRELRHAGIDAITLGDHAFKDRGIVPMLEDAAVPIARPANLAPGAPGKTRTRIAMEGGASVYVITVLGRLFMPLVSDNPFLAVDREMEAIADAGGMVIVEVHGEASSEKQAMAWHCAKRWRGGEGARVIAVVGSHTHVQTADARIIAEGLGAMTDLGMTGSHAGVIGRDANATLDVMVRQKPAALELAEEDLRARGCVITVEPEARACRGIEAIDIAMS